MRVPACGLDFGTSNSTLGLVDPDGQPRLVRLEDGTPTIPSALFFSFENSQTYFGRAAIGEYVTGGEGRMLRALKSLLGSALMRDKTWIGQRNVPFIEILGIFIAELRARAGTECGHALEQVVLGRPVQFVDGDAEADRDAQNQLELAVRAQGFRHIEFQYEPIAAALDYERTIGGEQLAMVADIGGGTSDFTIVRLSPARARAADRQTDILATGGVHVGGTDFDRLLSMAKIMPMLGLNTPTRDGRRLLPVGPYYDLSTWHRINRLYKSHASRELHEIWREAVCTEMVGHLIEIVERRAGHLLASHVEEAKIALTEAEITDFTFATGDVRLTAAITRKEFSDAIAERAERIPATIKQTLNDAGLEPADIETLVMTGGSTQIGAIRGALDRMFGNAAFVETDAFGSVGLGLALDASRRF